MYPILLFILNKFYYKIEKFNSNFEPFVSFIVVAYNEEDNVLSKLENTYALDYAKDKIEYIWVTDGSTDKTNEILSRYSNIKVVFDKEKNGKSSAINRGLNFATSPIVILSDANTVLSSNSIKELVKYFFYKNVGAVAGEKSIIMKNANDAQTSGEGIYWKYESFIKKLESNINCSFAAAGELIAFRKDLFIELKEDTILDDLTISLNVIKMGYIVKYSHKAISTETASSDVNEEMKRKIRIAAGATQLFFRFTCFLNIFKYKMLAVNYISHKVLRWFINPFAMIVLLFTNILLFNFNLFFQVIFVLQIFFYFLAIIGFVIKQMNVQLKIIFLPFYYVLINTTMIIGVIKFFRNKHTANWERSNRVKN